MTKKEENIICITNILDGTKEALLANIDKIPDEWTGYELRQYVVDYIDTNYVYRMKKSSMKAYQNDIITLNLL